MKIGTAIFYAIWWLACLWEDDFEPMKWIDWTK